MLFALGGASVVIAYTAACYLVGRLATTTIAVGTGLPAVLAAPAGASILGLELWGFGAIGIPWNPLTLWMAPAIVAIAARSRLRHAVTQDFEGARGWWRQSRADRAGRTFVVVVLVLFLSLCLWALVVQPLTGNDAVALWMFKAKLYLAQQRVGLEAVIQEPGRNLDYPPLYSLVADTLYVTIGGINDYLGKAVAFPFVLAAALTILVAPRGALRLRATGLWLLTLASLPLALNQVLFSGEMGYADFPVAALLMVVVAGVALAETTGDPSGYHFALLGAGIAAMLKNEGQVLLASTVLITGFRLAGTQSLRTRSLLTAAIAIAPVLVWKVVSAIAGYRAQTDAVLVVATQVAAYFVAYLFTRFDLIWQMTASYDRLALQVTPALILMLALGSSVARAPTFIEPQSAPSA